MMLRRKNVTGGRSSTSDRCAQSSRACKEHCRSGTALLLLQFKAIHGHDFRLRNAKQNAVVGARPRCASCMAACQAELLLEYPALSIRLPRRTESAACVQWLRYER
eukprot:6213198-Pleurochrysis_carterae.AAC.2